MHSYNVHSGFNQGSVNVTLINMLLWRQRDHPDIQQHCTQPCPVSLEWQTHDPPISAVTHVFKVLTLNNDSRLPPRVGRRQTIFVATGCHARTVRFYWGWVFELNLKCHNFITFKCTRFSKRFNLVLQKGWYAFVRWSGWSHKVDKCHVKKVNQINVNTLIKRTYWQIQV